MGREKTVRGHTKLFTLQMDLVKCEQLRIAGAAEDVGYGLSRDASSSMNRILLPIPESMSGR
jgi:hypothetical protein